MLNQKQIKDLTLFFLEELESKISFEVKFSIQDAISFPPDESVFYYGMDERVFLSFGTKSNNSYDTRIFPGFFKGSTEETEALIYHILELEERASKCLEKGYNKPIYDVSWLYFKGVQEFYPPYLLKGIGKEFTSRISELFGQLNNLEKGDIQKGILDAVKSHVKKRLIEIKHELNAPQQSCSFQIDEKVVLAYHVCNEAANIEDAHYLAGTRSRLELECFRTISSVLNSFLDDLDSLYPTNLITLSKPLNAGRNKHFKWKSWTHHYLIQHYCNRATENGLFDVGLPDFVNLLSGAEHKPQTLQWTGSKAVLSAILRDLHLGYTQEIKDQNVNSIVTPLQKVMRLEGLFAQLNDDPKSSDSRLEVPIKSQTSSGKDIQNQQLLESAGVGVRIKAIPQDKLKPHQELILDLLGITYQL